MSGDETGKGSSGRAGKAGGASGAGSAVAVRRQAVQLSRQEMPMQNPEVRISNFDEVNLGLDGEAARAEASRCLRCKKPKCIGGCPVSVDIPGFVGAVADGDMPKAVEILKAGNVLPCATGRVCPQEVQCEGSCVLLNKGEAVAIGHLERYVADWAMEADIKPALTTAPTGRRVAVVGSGPGGLACAGELRRRGHEVTVFEALHCTGGVLRYGIPEFRLPKAIVEKEVEGLKDTGVQVICNAVVGATCALEDLTDQMGFDAVFLACGAGFPMFLGIPGENLKGVYSANEFLTRINLMGAASGGRSATPVLTAKDVVVIGGGNTALDAVRTARRMGAHRATIAYRRSLEEMPARAEEVRHAREEGVQFELLANPVEIVSDDSGWVRALRCMKMQLSEPDESGRRRPVAIPGSEFEIECGVVIVAIGTRANPLLTRKTDGLKLDAHGYIQTDADGMTSLPGVFAGGDIVRGSATVILAMGDGKKTAERIDKYLALN